MNKFILTIATLAVFISGNLQARMEEPYYTLNVRATACLAEIRVNDYPVFSWETTRQVSIPMIPINYAILESGIQSISVTVLPNTGETWLDPASGLKFSIELYDANSFELDKEIAEYRSEPVGENEQSIIEYTDTFQADVPYKLDAWQTGINLKELDDCRKKLEEAYDNLFNLIQAGELEIFRQMISKRELKMATAMYLSKEESDKRIDELIDDLMNPDFKIQPIPENAVMVLYANNKVATLKKTTGEHVLSLINSETGEELTLDILFYIPEGKEEFEII